MKNVRKAIVLALALVMALSLAACAGGSSPSPAPGGTPAAPAAPGGSVGSADLTMWHIHTGENRNVPIQEGIDEFTAANPGVSVNVEIIANDVYKTQLRTAMAGGGGPCIFHSWGGGWLEAFVREGLVVDITDDVGGMTGNLVESAVRMTTIDGRLWGLPIINSGTFLYYNQKMFAELGINPPNTFAELENVVDTLKANNIVPFAEANLTRWPGAQHFVFLSMRLGGPDIFARAMAGEERFDHPAFIQAGEMLTDMVKNGWFPEGHNGMNWDTGESRTMFFLEQAGMILQTSGFISTAFNDAPDFFPNLGIHEYPSIAGGAGLKPTCFPVSTRFPSPPTPPPPGLPRHLWDICLTARSPSRVLPTAARSRYSTAQPMPTTKCRVRSVCLAAQHSCRTSSTRL